MVNGVIGFLNGMIGGVVSGVSTFVIDLIFALYILLQKEKLARQGIAVRAGLHCAPLAHESAGTLDTGTVRISFGIDAAPGQTAALLRAVSKLKARKV